MHALCVLSAALCQMYKSVHYTSVHNQYESSVCMIWPAVDLVVYTHILSVNIIQQNAFEMNPITKINT